MEEKKKITLSTIFMILAVIVIIIMAYFIYKFYNEKNVETQKVADLNNEINSLQSIVNNLNEKINNVSNIVNNSENSNKENNTESFNKNNIQKQIYQEISGEGYSAVLENNKITITLKSQERLWTDKDFSKPINNKKYIVEGLEGKIKKIVAANMAQDVSPEILILMDDGTVKYVDLSGPVFSNKNPDNIHFIGDNIPWATNLKNIIDIKVDGDYHYAIDNTGKEIKIWNNEA